MSIKSDKEYTRKLQAMSTEQLHKESNRLYASDHSTQKDIQSVAREQLVRMVLNYAPADAVAALFEPERRSCEDPDATYLCGFELAGGRIVTSKSNVQWCDYIQEAGQEIWNNDISSVSYGGARMPYVWEDDSPDGTLSLLIRPRKQTKPIQLETLTKKRLKEMTDAQLKKAWKQAESVYLLGDGQTLDQMNPYAEQALSILESTAAEMMRRKGFAPTGLTRSQMAKISTQDLEKFVNKHDQTVNALLKSLDPQIESPRWMFEIDVLDQQVNAALFQRHTLETRNEFEKIFHQIGLPQSKSKRLDANGLPLMVSGWEDLFVAADLDSLKKMESLLEPLVTVLVTAYSAKRAQPFSDLQAYVRHCLLLHQGLEVCAEKGLKTKALLRAEGEGMSQEELGKHMGKIYKLYKSCRGAKRQAVLAVYDTWCRQMVRINLRGEAPKGSVRAVASTHNFAGADQDCGCAVFYFEDARGARLEGSQPFGFKGLHRSPLCFDRLKPDGKQSSDLGKLWEIDV